MSIRSIIAGGVEGNRFFWEENMQRIFDYIGRHVHMVGIGGSSMSGLAEMLKTQGIRVTGSDSVRSYLTDALENSGIPVSIGHRSENLGDAELLIYSAAIHEDNPERMAAKEKGIPQMERAILLGQLMEGYRQAVNICGTHGKTTTTSMIAECLLECGLDPTIHIGGQLDAIGGSTRAGGHDVFVAEACEYNGSFLHFHPTIAVITNIEADHLDYYKDLDDIENAFRHFVSLLPKDGVVIGNGDDPRVLRILSEQPCRSVTFGMTEKSDIYPTSILWDTNGCASFGCAHGGETIAHIDLRIPGEFNLLHALAAMAVCLELGIAPDKAAESLSRFVAPHRRFEHTGDVCGVALYTDYGHNPAEMRTAVENAARRPHRRLFAVIQPHTYSRVKSLFAEYIHCCDAADEILITDIFAAREKDPGDIHATMLVNAIANTGKPVHYTPTFDDAERFLRSNWAPGDLVITMSGGDIHLLNAQIQAHGDVWTASNPVSNNEPQ